MVQILKKNNYSRALRQTLLSPGRRVCLCEENLGRGKIPPEPSGYGDHVIYHPTGTILGVKEGSFTSSTKTTGTQMS